MKKTILTAGIALASFALVFVACKKDDDKDSNNTTTSSTASTSSTATTATTATTSTTATTTTNPTPGPDQLAIDGQLMDYPVFNCFDGAANDWSITAKDDLNGNNTFIALFNPKPNATRDYTVSIAQPNGEPTKVRLTVKIDNVTYTASGGTAKVSIDNGVTNLKFTNISFVKTGGGTKTISGNLTCPQ